jgi:16S rRNA (guanine(966)-N(2))-methyltransferase RsmD
MRVTGGEWRGLILEPPKGPPIRTTLDHVRQAIFNLVAERVEGANVLDLFAGAGSLGIEALSRGAAQATFVDRSFFSIQAIRANLKSVSDTRCTVIRAEAMSAIRRLHREEARFDLVFLDPPYGGKLLTKSLNALCQYVIVSQAGWIVAECDKRSHLPPQIEGKEVKLLLQRHKQYGDTVLGVYETVGG